jgi:predicted RNase H-like HicB family nuclease
MNYNIEYEREEDGRWIAEVPQLPGVIAYGTTADEAMMKAEALVLRVLAEHPHTVPCLVRDIRILYLPFMMEKK